MLLLPLALPLMAPSAHAQGIQVAPVRLDLSADDGVAAMRVRNQREREIAFEATLVAWLQQDGEDLYMPTADIAVAPRIFAIPAGGEQIVRVALEPSLLGAQPDREGAYRLLLRELSPPTQSRGGLRVQLQMSLPVFVAPRVSRAELAAQRLANDDASSSVVLENTGSVHVRLAHARYGSEEAPIDALPRYLLAGESVILPLPANERTLEIVYAGGGDEPITQTLALDATVVRFGVR